MATAAERQRALADFSEAVDAFDDAQQRVAAFARGGLVLDELGDVAIATCEDVSDHRCTPETLLEYSGQMQVLAERFADLFGAFKRTHTSGTTGTDIRERFEVRCRSQEFAVAGFTSYTRCAAQEARTRHREAVEQAFDRLIQYVSTDATDKSVLEGNEAMLASAHAYCKSLNDGAERAQSNAKDCATALQEAKEFSAGLRTPR